MKGARRRRLLVPKLQGTTPKEHQRKMRHNLSCRYKFIKYCKWTCKHLLCTHVSSNMTKNSIPGNKKNEDFKHLKEASNQKQCNNIQSETSWIKWRKKTPNTIVPILHFYCLRAQKLEKNISTFLGHLKCRTQSWNSRLANTGIK